MEENDIAPKIPVYHRNNPSRIGWLTGQMRQLMCLMAQVNWGSGTEFVDISQLVAVDSCQPPSMQRDVREGQYGTIHDLRRRVTFEKLKGTLTDVFYSMKTSEIEFYPHQFKPVLRFIESATNRLLIADEVGLGKTIEAGLIWTEWQAREKARRLLVVCPPTLVPKWVRELQDRFHLPAEKVDAQQLLDLYAQFENRPSLSFVRVASYQALRPYKLDRDVLKQLNNEADEIEQSRLQKSSKRVELLDRIRKQADSVTKYSAEKFLNMVIFDEAHSMRNTASATNVLGGILSAAAGAMVCLSATPIHNQNRDLFALLRLIDPDVFPDEHVFDELCARNLSVVRLQNALAASNTQIDEIHRLVDDLTSAQDQERMAAALNDFDPSPRGWVELRHQAERLNVLNNFVNRTRKRDVIENRVLRQPVTIPVTLKPEESAFYKAVLDLVRREVRRNGGDVTSFHLIHPALRMSSSIPALAAEVREGRWGGFEEIEYLAEEDPEGLESERELDLPTEDLVSGLSTYDFEGNDSKYSALREVIRLIESRRLSQDDNENDLRLSEREKIIVFAFFKSTIAYLKRRLEADGIRTVAVTGDISDQNERDRLLSQFAEDENQVLLCSEIGAEGVDLQFARILVNYDLPWNPMRVEQRIGRIDRIGQQAPSIVIINFYVEDSIDGRIYTHLHKKIGVFERSIGALEGILGEGVAKLTAELFSKELTSEQLSEQADQTIRAIETRAREMEQIESSTGALVAFQDLLSEKIGESQRLGRYLKPDELRLHLQDFFASRYQGTEACQLFPDNPASECMECKFSFRALMDFENYCQEQELAWPDGFDRTARRAQITFDPTIHEKNRRRHPRLILVTHLHPFFRWITKENLATNNTWHKVSAIRINTDRFDPGRYFYLIYRMTFDGITRKDAFLYGVMQVGTDLLFTGDRAEELVGLALDRGESLFPQQTPDLSGMLEKLQRALDVELTRELRTFRDDQSQKMNIRLQQTGSHFDRLISDQKKRIETSVTRNVRQGGLQGFLARLQNLERMRDEQLTKIEEKAANLTESFDEVACGLIDVQSV